MSDSRERAAELRKSLDRANDELALLREHTLDVFPGLELPERVQQVCAGVRAERLTYLSPSQLRSLVCCVVETERQSRPGLIIEAGTALGGSAIAMAAAKDPARPMVVFDAFGMIPPPSDRDTEREINRYRDIVDGKSRGLGGETYYGYRGDLLGEVAASFERFGIPVDQTQVRLVKGLFEDTIDLDEPVALAHLDGDWYDSTMVCLERIAPLLVEGGRLVIDDYHYWSGCRRAVDEFFSGRKGFRLEYRAKVHAVRLG